MVNHEAVAMMKQLLATFKSDDDMRAVEGMAEETGLTVKEIASFVVGNPAVFRETTIRAAGLRYFSLTAEGRWYYNTSLNNPLPPLIRMRRFLGIR